jgi:hypothetical protein
MSVVAIIIFSVTLAGDYWDRGGQRMNSHSATDSIARASENSNAPRAQKTVSFSSRISKGQSFEKQIGVNLFFRLIPDELGWTISVGSNSAPKNNFCGVVTPPYRGINAIHIEGWHFRNADNSGPNEAGPKNVNAPQKAREFHFVLNDGDYRKAFDALQILLWPYSSSKQEITEAESVHAKLPKGNGALTIRDLKLNRLDVGKQAGVDGFTFDVELNFPG